MVHGYLQDEPRLERYSDLRGVEGKTREGECEMRADVLGCQAFEGTKKHKP